MMMTDPGRIETVEDIVKELRDRVNCHNEIIIGLDRRLQSIEYAIETMSKTVNSRISAIAQTEVTSYKIILLQPGERPTLMDLENSEKYFPENDSDY